MEILREASDEESTKHLDTTMEKLNTLIVQEEAY